MSAPTSRLALRAVSDLSDAFDPGTLAAMQYDAEQLAARNDETAGAWQALADALGSACALAEHDERERRTRS
ncbi:hypothetical protein [Paractinoplanes atraurantiacus]|uniref:Uncharacterized protein n=1 Tax=Paractinoplanes atraurantiacus TaxID=1036182 RepID=A0A285KM24_9ACTN|nr:hypothetical protein [Actinoplanes atraurantiacus]SNY72927.1 hypothetical protein SAMN05421748_14462 [Actinoplanes atraurantiacus]